MIKRHNARTKKASGAAEADVVDLEATNVEDVTEPPKPKIKTEPPDDATSGAQAACGSEANPGAHHPPMM